MINWQIDGDRQSPGDWEQSTVKFNSNGGAFDQRKFPRIIIKRQWVERNESELHKETDDHAGGRGGFTYKGQFKEIASGSSPVTTNFLQFTFNVVGGLQERKFDRCLHGTQPTMVEGPYFCRTAPVTTTSHEEK